MKPFTIEKQVITAKSRTLKATWTYETTVDLESELAKKLADEIEAEFLKEVYRNKWTQVFVKNWAPINDDWCKKYIKKQYKCLGHYWYFESDKDAEFFALRWSS